jgi:hypothetical protein
MGPELDPADLRGKTSTSPSTVTAIEQHLRRGNHLYGYATEDNFGSPRTSFTVCTHRLGDAVEQELGGRVLEPVIVLNREIRPRPSRRTRAAEYRLYPTASVDSTLVLVQGKSTKYLHVHTPL